MSDLNVARARRVPQFAGTFGNVSTPEHFRWTGDAAQNDKIYLGVIPSGYRVFDLIVDTTALGATVTLDVGYEAVAPGSSLTPDLDYWVDGADVSGVSRTRSAAVGVRFEEEVWLVATALGANPAAGTIAAYPLGVYEGQA